MAAEVGKTGAHGLRVLVKKIAFDLKTEIANVLETVTVKSEGNISKIEVDA
jgi:hypothetical protein